MLIGLGSYIFRYSIGTPVYQPEKPLTAPAMIERAASLGAQLLQFAENLPLDDLPYETLLQIKRNADKTGITLEAGTAGATEEQLLKHLRIAGILDAKLLRISLHSGKIKPGRDEAIQAFRNVLPKFREANIEIAIENHFTMKSDDLFDLVKEINDPLVGICLDMANSIVQKEWPEDTLRILGPLAKSLHLKDFQMGMHPDGIGINVRGVTLGEGMQDLQLVSGFLKDHHRDINVVLEQWMPTAETKEETLQREEQWIRKSLEIAGQSLK